MLYSVHQNIYTFSKSIYDYIIPEFEFHEEEKSDVHCEFFQKRILCLI